MKRTHELTSLARRLLLVLALASPALAARSDVPAKGYPVLRYEEDHSQLCSAPPSGFLRALKCVPLGSSGRYLSLGGEARAQFERYSAPGWGAAREDRSGYLLQRYLLHGDLHLGSGARVFLQVKSGIESGRLGGPRPPDEDLLDIHQGFLDVRLVQPLTVRLGRQELAFGSGRLISVRDGPNVRQSFDGLRALGDLGDARISVFLTRPARTRRGYFDDAVDTQRLLWGAYVVQRLPGARDASLDLYYIGHRRTPTTIPSGTRPETRHSLGTRVAGGAGGLRYDAEGIFQLESFGGNRIRAWLLALDGSYGRPHWPLGARAGLTASAGSGDGDPTDGSLGTFHPLYARGAELGPALLSPGNLFTIRPGLSLSSPGGLVVRAEYAAYWRRSLSDGIYDVTGAPLVPARGSSARPVGQEASLLLGLDLAESATTVLVSYTRFLAGRFLEDATPGKDLGYASVVVRRWF